MTDLAALAAVAVVVALAAWWLRARDRVVAPAHGVPLAPAALDTLGLPHGRGGVVVFTAPGCSQCAPAQDAVAAVAGQLEVRTVDAASRPDLAAAHEIRRAPTVLVIDAAGQVAARIHGVPHRGTLAAIVDGLQEG